MKERQAPALYFTRSRSISTQETFSLDAAGIEFFSERLGKLLQILEIERQNQIRIRFSFEESLLRLRDRFGEDREFSLKVDSSFGRTYIQIELEGAIYNPLSKTEADLEDWSGSLLTAVGLSPIFSYSKGKNILRLNLARKGMNSALKILIAVIIGVIVGIVLRAALPAAYEGYLVEEILQPLYDFWVRLLSVLSGPVIFFVVCNTVLNTRAIREEGGSSRKIVARYFIFSILASLLSLLVSEIIFFEPVIAAKSLGISMRGTLETLLQFMPENAVDSILSANTPQILVLAFVVGGVISALGPRGDSLNSLIHQGSAAGLLITEGVSRMVPYFAAALICMEIVRGNLKTLFGMWRVLVFSILVMAIVLIVVLFYVSIRKKVSYRTLWKKLYPSFRTAVRSGGLDEGYGQMERSCIDQLGMERHFAVTSLPHGMVLYMPANVIGTLMFTVYAALQFKVEITAGWLIGAMVMTVILFVATPPVPGANLLAYIMIFAQLGIPSSALIVAMIFDIFFGIFASAGNQTLLQLELILQADKIGLLDREKLRKKPRPVKKKSAA